MFSNVGFKTVYFVLKFDKCAKTLPVLLSRRLVRYIYMWVFAFLLALCLAVADLLFY